MSLKYEPASAPQHISAKWLFLNYGRAGDVELLGRGAKVFFFFLLLSSLELSDTQVYEP